MADPKRQPTDGEVMLWASQFWPDVLATWRHYRAYYVREWYKAHRKGS